MTRMTRGCLWLIAAATFLGGGPLSGQPTWTPIGAQYIVGFAPSPTNYGLLPDPGDPSAVYLLTPQGVVRYNQSTQTSAVLPGSPILKSLAVSPSNPQVLYGSTGFPHENGRAVLFKSPDGGQTWTDISSNLPSLTPQFLGTLAVDPSDANVLYATVSSFFGPRVSAIYDGLFRSADGGSTWALVKPPDDIDVQPQLAISVGSPATLFLFSLLSASSSTLSRSSDGGASWTSGTVPSTLPLLSPVGLLADPRSSSTVYLYGLNSVFRSLDRGSSWTPIGLNDLSPNYFVQALAVDPNAPSTLLATESSSGVHRTTDGGGHWSVLDSGLQCPNEPCFYASGLAFTNASPSVAFLNAVSPFSGFYRTGLPSAGSCSVSSTVLCAGYGRYSVSVEWSTGGVAAPGNAVVITPNSSGFWFFSPDNVDLVVKVLDGRDVNGHVWVFYGSLTNVEFTLTITDTQTGSVKSYVNPQGQLASVADTAAF